jgi:hypothetical protein
VVAFGVLSGLRTAGVPMTWYNTSEGKASPLAVALANASASSFLAWSICCRVKPLNCLSRLRTVVRYCMSEGSFAEYSFSTWPATTLESVRTMHVVTPSARSLRSPRMTPVGAVIIVVALAPAWHHASSQWMVHTFSGDSSCLKSDEYGLSDI